MTGLVHLVWYHVATDGLQDGDSAFIVHPVIIAYGRFSSDTLTKAEVCPLDKLIEAIRLSSRIARESAQAGLAAIDELIDRAARGEILHIDTAILERIRKEAQGILHTGSMMVGASVIVPAGLMSFFRGLRAPDADIRVMGIGRHRFFLFHSALGVVALRYLYRLWVEREENHGRPGLLERAVSKVAGAALGAYAVGVGVHLAVDIFQPKAVIFPFFGSLVNGTLIDDNIWLLGNSLWALRIARDVIVITFAPELAMAKAFAKDRFAEWSEQGYQTEG